MRRLCLSIILLCSAAFVVWYIQTHLVEYKKVGQNTHASTPSTEQTTSSLHDTITVLEPLRHSHVLSPLVISGRARGSWFFEAVAPVTLLDAHGTILGTGTIRALQPWTTENFISFVGTLTYRPSTTPGGTLILKNDNPSGDPGREKELDIPVVFY